MPQRALHLSKLPCWCGQPAWEKAICTRPCGVLPRSKVTVVPAESPGPEAHFHATLWLSCAVTSQTKVGPFGYFSVHCEPTPPLPETSAIVQPFSPSRVVSAPRTLAESPAMLTA